MRYLYSIVSLVITLTFTSCMQTTPLPQNNFKNSASVEISMNDDTKDKNNYRVYINHKDTNLTLIPDKITRFYVSAGEVNIQVVKKRETASMNLLVQSKRLYKLRIFKDERAHIQLLQVSNSLNE